ncbi:hypothetical protein O181_049156 [Austropuccinia psidii MF-1]|uniref:Uncharacterized protein n=1 Tax=Austropuccinia psidii MF-1 TaxID=1389203 RepID=A0A9Q3HL33_9BASI|nr:hypothetical protein [Austropuccinia psidii MF-1]
MLTLPHPPPDETVTLPPHLHPHHSLCFCTPASSSPQLKILTLLQGPQVMPPTPPSPPLTPPYTHGVPSRHSSLRRLHSAHLTCL